MRKEAGLGKVGWLSREKKSASREGGEGQEGWCEKSSTEAGAGMADVTNDVSEQGEESSR
jgi:hypothetical protein